MAASEVAGKTEVLDLAQSLVSNRPDSPWLVSRRLQIQCPPTASLSELRRIRQRVLWQRKAVRDKIDRKLGDKPYYLVAVRQVDSLYDNYLQMLNEKMQTIIAKRDQNRFCASLCDFPNGNTDANTT